MASSTDETITVTQKAISEKIIFYTENKKGPPAWFKYYFEANGFQKVKITLNFEGSSNFELVGEGIIPKKPLQAILSAEPGTRSNEIIVQQINMKKGGSLTMNITYTIEKPDKEKCKEFLEISENKLKSDIENGKMTFPPDIVKSYNLEQIQQKCHQASQSFIDISFPPLITSLFDGHEKTDDDKTMVGCNDPLILSNGTPIIWRRPIEFMGKNTIKNTASNSSSKNNPPSASGAAAPTPLKTLTATISHSSESLDIRLFRGIEPADIKQGALGNCWLMCALAACSEFPSLVESMFPPPYNCYNEQGFYKVKLCKNGEWVIVTLDDFFPCTPLDGPVYSRANGNELWVLLLEKAFAKLHGSYALLRSGWPFEAMMDLTGAPYKDYRIKDAEVQKQIADGSLWSYICECDQMGYIMSLSTPGTDTWSGTGQHGTSLPSGLVPGHAYTMIAAVTTKCGYKLAHIRNPWGSTEWTGDFSDTSSLWTPELIAEVNFVNDSNDGTFWMTFEDVIKHFVGINICMSRHHQKFSPWYESRHPIEMKFSKKGKGLIATNMFLLKITNISHSTKNNDNSEFFSSIHQQDKRCLHAKPYIDFGITIVQKTDNPQKFKFIASSGNSMERQNQLEIKNLPVGDYLIIPTSTGAKFEQYRAEAAGEIPVESTGSIATTGDSKSVKPPPTSFQPKDYSRHAVVVIHSSEPFEMSEVPYNKYALEEAIELPVIHGENRKDQDLFGDGSVILHTRRSGYAGISYVASNFTSDEALRLELDFSESVNVISHRGKLKASVIVPPQEAKVIHHIMPKDDSKDWTAGWACAADWISIDDMKSAIKEEDIDVELE